MALKLAEPTEDCEDLLQLIFPAIISHCLLAQTNV